MLPLKTEKKNMDFEKDMNAFSANKDGDGKGPKSVDRDGKDITAKHCWRLGAKKKGYTGRCG